jgi:hypothetical protein
MQYFASKETGFACRYPGREHKPGISGRVRTSACNLAGIGVVPRESFTFSSLYWDEIFIFR